MSSHNNENQISHRNNNSLFRDSFFDDQFENDFFNHPLISFSSIYPYYHRDPFNDLHNQISKAFNSGVFKSVDFSPKINLSEDENNYYIHADLPGMNKDQIKMELSDDNHVLTISGERESIIDNSDNNNDDTNDDNKNKENSNKRNTKKYSKIECSYGKFSRSFTLPENADINKIQARLENGVLEVHLPKLEPTKKEQRKTIQIQ
ncbi:HSP20-like chaperone [Neocallimastix californiae]|uniref:HSP20-like chaperone n=1 Tax=Neocallimastix californiae TaxID=1754190 RepID=A0A1Y2B717_9FUNG|nr:HSP20-like chaperone [Neocallimastix californiae]|eukprot:ORY30629.1 HSP20-like chaperone [Neocallimastix californiae]